MSAPKKDMMRQFTRGEIQTARKSGKYSDLLVTKLKQIKTSFPFFFPFKLTKMKRIKWPALSVVIQGSLIHCGQSIG